MDTKINGVFFNLCIDKYTYKVYYMYILKGGDKMSKKERFNFFIDPKLNKWLGEIAWQNKMSKAAYLIMLLEKDKKEKEGF